MHTTLSVALDLASRGIPVFPVKLVRLPSRIDKVPLIQDWRNNASANPDQIRVWLATPDPDQVIGVPTGAVSKRTILDIDPRNGGDAWHKQNKHRLPDTERYDTLQGGTHLVFQYEQGLRGKPAPGVDLLNDGQFAVHWPGYGKLHHKTEPAEVPLWLLEAASRRATGSDGATPLSQRRPPSAQAVVDLLNRMPNPAKVDRDLYVTVMLSARGCIVAMEEADSPATPEEAIAIEAAAVSWARRWERYKGTDEAAKWTADWGSRPVRRAGWETLQRVAERLIPGYREEVGAQAFTGEPWPRDDTAQASKPKPEYTRGTAERGHRPYRMGGTRISAGGPDGARRTTEDRQIVAGPAVRAGGGDHRHSVRRGGGTRRRVLRRL
jgi:Bifunctional DNA primase/polymerase, N-terminal